MPYGQFLISVPLFIIAEFMIGRRVGWAVAELRRSDVLAPADTPVLDDLLERVVRCWNGRSANAVLLFLTLVATMVSTWNAQGWLTGGWQYDEGGMTLPGWWYQLVSLPVMRFLALRWLWRMILWAWVLWKIAGLSLKPQPAHPDRSGGLAFLGGAQASFSWLVLALGAQLSCLAADAVYYQGADPMSFKMQILAFVVIVLVIVLLPLLVFAPKLAYAREEQLIELSGKGYQGISRLLRLLRSSSAEEWPNNDVSGMCDYCTLFENARLMRPLPLELRHVLILILAAVLPFVPLVFVAMPAQEVLKTLFRLLI